MIEKSELDKLMYVYKKSTYTCINLSVFVTGGIV